MRAIRYEHVQAKYSIFCCEGLELERALRRIAPGTHNTLARETARFGYSVSLVAQGPKVRLVRVDCRTRFPKEVRACFLEKSDKRRPFEVEDVSGEWNDKELLELISKVNNLVIQCTHLGWVFYVKYQGKLNLLALFSEIKREMSEHLGYLKSHGRHKRVSSKDVLCVNISEEILFLEDFHQVMAALIYNLGGMMRGSGAPTEKDVSDYLGISKDFLRRIKEQSLALMLYHGAPATLGLEERGKVVVFPGRFQPLHIGHVYTLIELMRGNPGIVKRKEDARLIFPISRLYMMIGPREHVRRERHPLFVGERVHLFRRVIQEHPFLRTVSNRIRIGVSPGSEDELWVAKMLRELGEQEVDAVVSSNTQTLQHVEDITTLVLREGQPRCKPVELDRKDREVRTDKPQKWLKEVLDNKDFIVSSSVKWRKKGSELDYGLRVRVSGTTVREAIKKSDDSFLKKALPATVFYEMTKANNGATLLDIMANILKAR